MVEVDFFRGDRLFTGKGQQLAGEVSRPQGGGFNFFEFQRYCRIFPVTFESHLGIAKDYAEHIVEIMGHAAGQSPYRLHFQSLLQLRLDFIFLGLGLFQPGNILKDNGEPCSGQDKSTDAESPDELFVGIVQVFSFKCLAGAHDFEKLLEKPLRLCLGPNFIVVQADNMLNVLAGDDCCLGIAALEYQAVRCKILVDEQTGRNSPNQVV